METARNRIEVEERRFRGFTLAELAFGFCRG
jgi:hypothetical protein